MSPKRLYLIDAYGFLFRAYHSMPPLTRSDGTPVGAVLGFTNMLLKLKQKMDEDHAQKEIDHYVAVVMDSGKKTFRNDIYPAYKANRPEPPDDLRPQFALIRDAITALNMPGLEQVGVEADDIIATLVQQARAQSIDVVIVSSDKDLMQLIGEGVSMYDAAKDKRIGPKEVEEKFGVTPDKVLDVLSLMGDSSDNVPGVPGIGPKTAAELILQFGNLDSLLERSSEITQNKRRESLQQFADQARLSQDLIRLRNDVKLTESLEDLQIRSVDSEQLVTYLNTMEFKALSARVQKNYNITVPEPKPVSGKITVLPVHEERFVTITQSGKLTEWLANVQEKLAVILIEKANEPVGIVCVKAPGEAAFIPVSLEQPQAQQGMQFLPAAPETNSLPLEEVGRLLQPILCAPHILKIGHDAKRLSVLLRQQIAPLDDMMVMSYVLFGTTRKHTLKEMLEEEASMAPEATACLQFEKKSGGEINAEELCRCADALYGMYGRLRNQLFKEQLLTVYETIERPLVPVLGAMEQQGVKLDLQALNELSRYFSERIAALELDIFRQAGKEFTIGSPKQLGEVLFEHMGLQGGKTSKKSGAYSTGADILEEMAAQGHVIATQVLEWRQFSKLKSTYSDALAQHIHQRTGRVHTTFNMTVTNTGRLSSVDPNLQNIPIRTEEGRKIRAAFVAEKGCVLVSADYSQIELRLLAHMADLPTLKEAFRQGLDIHSITASQVFNIPVKQVDAEHRRRAKAINFGIIYGQSAFGLAASLGIAREDAKRYIESYFQQYPGIKQYMETTKQFAHEHGYVKTLFGRKCFVPGILTKGPMRAFAERAAINAPLQGTAADIIKRAMIALQRQLQQTIPEAKLVLQVHDELLLEVPEALAEKAMQMTKSVMQQAVKLSVPLVVEAKAGKNWGEAH